jgi:hypothetical protein
VTGPRHRLGVLALAVVTAVAGSGCTQLMTRVRPAETRSADAILAAGIARERSLVGLRLTLSVRATAGPPAARLASPAYLAIDDPEHLRLQVLSPFGVTVLDLATSGDTYTLQLPMRGEKRDGRIDLAALAAGTMAEDERMIVALALLFRSKMDRARCRAAGPVAVTCAVATDLTATISVDAALRPVREEYRGSDGRTFLVAELSDYPAAVASGALPERITISDGQGGPALVIRVVRSRRATDPAPA